MKKTEFSKKLIAVLKDYGVPHHNQHKLALKLLAVMDDYYQNNIFNSPELGEKLLIAFQGAIKNRNKKAIPFCDKHPDRALVGTKAGVAMCRECIDIDFEKEYSTNTFSVEKVNEALKRVEPDGMIEQTGCPACGGMDAHIGECGLIAYGSKRTTD